MVSKTGSSIAIIIYAAVPGFSAGELDSLVVDRPEWSSPPYRLEYLLPKEEPKAKRHFYVAENGFVLCGSYDRQKDTFTPQANDPAGKLNNQLVGKIEHIYTQRDVEHALQNLFEEFRKAVQRSPLFYPFWYNLAVLSLRLKYYQKAALYFSKAHSLIPQDWHSLIGKGMALRKMGHKLEAIYQWKKAMKINRFSVRAPITLANFYFKEGMLTRAKKYYEMANKIVPDHPDALAGLGKIFYERGEYFKATLYFRRIKTKDIYGRPIRYNREFHFYYARSLTEIRDYQRAVAEYDKLLQHPEDPFFIEIPYRTVQRLRNIAHRLALIQKLRGY